MKKGQYSTEQIIGFLKAHEAGAKVADLMRKHGFSLNAASRQTIPLRCPSQLTDDEHRLSRLFRQPLVELVLNGFLERQPAIDPLQKRPVFDPKMF